MQFPLNPHTYFQTMTDQEFNVKNEDFEKLAPRALRRIGENSTFSDVTLVSREGDSIRGHKVIFASFSKIFEHILVNNSNTNPIIYMNNIGTSTLRMLKDFIYFGCVQVPSNKVNDFVKLGGELGIEGLVEQREDSEKENEGTFETASNYETSNLDGCIEQKQEGESQLNCIETNNDNIKSSCDTLLMHDSNDIHKNREGLFCCQQCGHTSKWKHDVKSHILSVHEGVKYNCTSCSFKTSYSANLRKHVKSVHDQEKFECDRCDYKASRPETLRQHAKSVHDKVKYECESCNYETSWPNHLKQHEKLVHSKSLIKSEI